MALDNDLLIDIFDDLGLSSGAGGESRHHYDAYHQIFYIDSEAFPTQTLTSVKKIYVKGHKRTVAFERHYDMDQLALMIKQQLALATYCNSNFIWLWKSIDHPTMIFFLAFYAPARD